MKTINSGHRNHGTEIWLIGILCLTSALAWGQADVSPGADANSVEPVPLKDVRLELNFQDVPIRTVVEYLSEKAGLVIIAEDGLDRRITVISRRFLSIDEAVSLLDSVLKDGGYTAIRQGRTLRIVSLNQAQYHPVPVVEGTDPEVVTPGDNMEYRIIPIRFRDAVQLRDNLQPLIPDYAILQANQEGNVLMLMDTTANIKRILEIVHALDKPLSAVAQIQVFQLRNADASSTAELINKLFEQDAQASNSNNQRNRSGRFGGFEFGPGGRGRRGGDDQESSTTGGSERGYVPVNAAADDRTNAVVVSAPAERMAVIEEVIRGIDTRQAEIADVRVFHLEYADAQNTAELINDVFGLTGRSRSQSQQQNNRQFGRGFPGFPGIQDQQDSTGSNADVIASADQRTNSVVVSGPPDTLAVIATVIKELDANPEQERRIFAYALKNANATNLMTILNDLFVQMQNLQNQGTGRNTQQFRGAGGGGIGGQTANSSSSDSSGLDEETYFEAEAESNILLTMTSTKNYEKIKPIIEELDKPVGQVLIKVLFAEVTYNDTVDLGVEFSMLNLNNEGSTLTSTTWLNPLLQGLSINSTEGDLETTIRALQDSGRLNVLSRPYILTSNNQMARITVGSQVPVATGASISSAGSQTTTDYNDVGIILEVTPSINPEGLVNMTIQPEISTLTGQEIAISQELTLPVFSRRMAQTKVAVKDGQTIVIGGLIQDEVRDNVVKVPLLGDVPLAGALFRRTEKVKNKTELLIFLTPYVALEPKDLTPISNNERSRSNFNNDAAMSELFKKHMEDMEKQTDPNDH